jgi:predicted P-loop ATPase
LFAEALHLYRSGARCYPTRDEERNLFEPEQRERLIQEGWEEIVKNYLSNPETDIRLCNFFTSVDLLTKAIGMEKHKVDDRQMMRLGRIMSKIGWERRRCPSGTRPWGYIRPEEQRESSIIFPVATISVPDFGDD